MKTTLIKGGVGLLCVGGLSLAGYYGIKSSNSQGITKKSNIRDILEKRKYTLLNSGNSHISTVLEKYRAASGDTLKFENFNGNDSGGKKANVILLEKCNAIFESIEISNKTNIEKAIKWCVEPITVASLLEKNQISGLKTNDDTDDNKWDTKIKAYINSRNSERPKIAGLNLSDYSDSNKTQKINDIKGKCGDLSGKSNYEDKFEDNLELFNLWCANN